VSPPLGIDLYLSLHRRCGTLGLIFEGDSKIARCFGTFCDLRQLMVNLSKTKVMIFNGSKKVLLDHHFLFRGEEIQITNTYTYLGCNS
jgi:hypothetical protein